MNRKKNITTTTISKKQDKLYYWLLIAGLAFFIAHTGFIDAKTIGNDSRYDLFVIWVPTLVGIVIIGLCVGNMLIVNYQQYKGALKLLVIAGYLLMGFAYSFFSFTSVAMFTWSYINENIANKNATDIIYCPVESFWTGKNSKVYFEFNGHLESFNISRTSYSYKNPRAGDYKLEIVVRKGIWNHYLVSSWDIVKR